MLAITLSILGALWAVRLPSCRAASSQLELINKMSDTIRTHGVMQPADMHRPCMPSLLHCKRSTTALGPTSSRGSYIYIYPGGAMEVVMPCQHLSFMCCAVSKAMTVSGCLESAHLRGAQPHLHPARIHPVQDVQHPCEHTPAAQGTSYMHSTGV